MLRWCTLVLCLAGAGFAQETSCESATRDGVVYRLRTDFVLLDTGPLFNPSQAAHFDYSSLVFPSLSSLPAIQPSDAFSMATTISGIVLPTTLSRSQAATSRSSSLWESPAAPSSASSSASRTASSIVSSAATSAAASVPAQQSTAAAVANRAGVVGVVAGGLLAGLAMA